MMDWVKITLDTRAEHTDRLSHLLTEAGAVAVTLKNAGEASLYEPGPGEIPLWGDIQVEGLFEPGTSVEAVMRRLHEDTEEGQITAHNSARLADRPWERACLDAFQPMRFGANTWICPSWQTAPAGPGAVVVELDPGLAFGTGSHATTALCLEWLDRHPPAGDTVIDYGCGSGVLAVAAAKHGADGVWAVDHDPQALTATRANAAKNHVEGRVTACLPGGLANAAADLLIANILAGPLMELAPGFAGLVRPGGSLVLSGLLADQADRVTDVYRQWFEIVDRRPRQEWFLLEGRRRAGGAGAGADSRSQ